MNMRFLNYFPDGDGGGTGDGGEVNDWSKGLEPEFVSQLPEGFREKHKGKDLKTFIKDNAATESFVGKKLEGMVKIPGQNAGEEEIKAFRKALGVPESVDGYKLTMPQGLPEEDVRTFEGLSSVVRAAALKAGAPPSVVEQVWGEVAGALAKQNTDLEAEGRRLMQADIDSQKAELGEKYGEYLEKVSRVFSKLGKDKLKEGETKTIGDEFRDTLATFGLLVMDDAGKIVGGNPAVMKTVAELIPLVLEDSATGGDGSKTGKDDWFTDYSHVGAGGNNVNV